MKYGLTSCTLLMFPEAQHRLGTFVVSGSFLFVLPNMGNGRGGEPHYGILGGVTDQQPTCGYIQALNYNCDIEAFVKGYTHLVVPTTAVHCLYCVS